jgi:ATP-dependent DNA helicase RecQ
VLFYRHQNLGIRKFQKGAGKVQLENIEQIAQVIQEEDGPVAAETIVEKTDLSERKVISALHRLEDAGAVEALPTGEVELKPDVELNDAAQSALQEEEAHRERNRRRLEQMQEYAELTTCRRQYLLRYFGDDLLHPCGNCDVCLNSMEQIVENSALGTRREVVS